MGSNDTPPSHVPSYYLQTANLLLQTGGALWTLCYILLTLRSFQDRSYGMPLFALSYNFAWEFVYGLLIAEAPLERVVFTLWLLLDLGMVYGLLKYGKEEWNHAPLINRNLGKVFWGMTVWCIAAHWAFASWWLKEGRMREGKWYGGVEGPDTTELGWWTALFSQTYLSVASLGQLLVRQHTGGVSWGVWASRTLGSIIGLDMNYAWMWYHWPEAHGYFLQHVQIF
ncbi:hypothetical protein N431DRAFT_382346 [Stipitochalara longipes BDJ]|nr:hypothetical protein N431DRAFT_382346 [Stipitochalara longipes BDJ]